jgi:hypothetical protein
MGYLLDYDMEMLFLANETCFVCERVVIGWFSFFFTARISKKNSK